MNPQKDDHSITGSPLMRLEFIIIHTLIWGFLLNIFLYHILNFLVSALWGLPGIGILLRPLMPFLYILLLFLKWPTVMLTALIITIIRCIFRRTKVTLSGDTVIIRRLRRADSLLLSDFVRPKTVETFVGYNLIGWVFRKRYLIFRNDAEKEVKYRLYEYSESDLDRVMQLLTRVNRTEHLAEEDKTEMMLNAFQNELEVRVNPKQLWRRMARRLGLLCLICLAVFPLSTWLFYRMLFIPPQYDTGSVFLEIIGYGSILLSLGSLFLLCRTLWALGKNAILKASCPQKISFTGNMLQIDRTMYSANRIKRVTMNAPLKKLPLFGCYQITLVTAEGTDRYWLGDTAGLGSGNWQTLSRGMQELLISCPAKLSYR